MPRSISQQSLVDAVIRGIETAQSFYWNCTGDSWLWEAPEFLLSARIAESIHSLNGPKFLTLESNVRDTLRWAGAVAAGRPKKVLPKKGRFDAVVWWGDGSPRAVIEVKNNVWSCSQIQRDIERISNVIQAKRECNSLQLGMSAFYASAMDNNQGAARQQLEKRLETIGERAKHYATSSVNVTLVKGNIHVVGDSAWAATCLVLRARPEARA